MVGPVIVNQGEVVRASQLIASVRRTQATAAWRTGMRKSATVGCCTVALAIITGSVMVTSIAEASDRAADERAIREVIAGTTAAFNSHDARAFARFYTADADLVTVRGEVMRGAVEIERGLAKIFATRAHRAALKTLDVRVRFIRPDVCVAHVTNEMSGVVGPDGEGRPVHRELSVRVLVREDGVWRVSAFHNTIVATQTAATLLVPLEHVSAPSNNELQRTMPAQAMKPRR